MYTHLHIHTLPKIDIHDDLPVIVLLIAAHAMLVHGFHIMRMLFRIVILDSSMLIYTSSMDAICITLQACVRLCVLQQRTERYGGA